jgi:hypothetical protein
LTLVGLFLYCNVQRLTLILGNFLKFLGGWGVVFYANSFGIFENLDCGYGTVFMSYPSACPKTGWWG